MKDYRAFLEAKRPAAPSCGTPITVGEVNPICKPHQRDIIRWAVTGGRRGVFAKFGLGKTIITIEIQRLTLAHADPSLGGMGLIVCPLGVRQEFLLDAEKLGEQVRFIQTTAELDGPGIYLTNYESVREGKIDVSLFTVVNLDEASILRGLGNKTFREFYRGFINTPFKFVATATPAPNEYIEILNYAMFLGVMDIGEAKTRFFRRNSEKSDSLTLHPHKEREFWLWVTTWAVFLQRPSELGYSDEGYELPPLEVRWHSVGVDHSGAGHERDGQQRLLQDAALGIQEAAAVKRSSLPDRIAKVHELIQERPDDHVIIWHDLEDERRSIESTIPDVVAVYGSQDLDERERAVMDFAFGRIPRLAAKPVMLGSGCNLQRHCHWAIFAGVGFKFNDFIQSIHRIYRFLQPGEVSIDIIFSESETEIVKSLKAKWKRHDEMMARMSEIIREYGLFSLEPEKQLERSMGVERREASGRLWDAINNDAVDEAALMATSSVGLLVTSIPFSTQYEYTPSYNDFGHTDDEAHFFRQMDYLTPNLLRVLEPGRMCCVHVKDRVRPGGYDNRSFQSISLFHARTALHFERHGFIPMGMITVVTDVVRENNQTYRLGWSEQCKDGSRMGVGLPEYVLLFRKAPTDASSGYADNRVEKTKQEYSRGRWQQEAHALWKSSGDRLMEPGELVGQPWGEVFSRFRAFTTATVYDHERVVAITEAMDAASQLPPDFMLLQPGVDHPDVWTDVVRMRTLNGAQAAKGREMHLCPLQFDIVDRLINRFSNPGDVVFDPFAGLMTVPLRAVELGRRGRGVELNPRYFADGVRYLEAAEEKIEIPSLFDLPDVAELVEV